MKTVEANQGYIHYRKGSVVMYYLKEMIGEDKVNAALRTLVDRFAYKDPPYPTSIDLIDALRAQTPSEHHPLLQELFEKITLYSNRAISAKAKKLADDRWQVTLEVESEKFEADETGKETVVPFDQLIEVGAFAAPAEGQQFGETLFREKRRIASGRTVVTFETRQRPETAGVDPFLLLIDRLPGDNVRKVVDE